VAEERKKVWEKRRRGSGNGQKKNKIKY